jgi:hypothetical protein
LERERRGAVTGFTRGERRGVGQGREGECDRGEKGSVTGERRGV